MVPRHRPTPPGPAPARHPPGGDRAGRPYTHARGGGGRPRHRPSKGPRAPPARRPVGAPPGGTPTAPRGRPHHHRPRGMGVTAPRGGGTGAARGRRLPDLARGAGAVRTAPAPSRHRAGAHGRSRGTARGLALPGPLSPHALAPRQGPASPASGPAAVSARQRGARSACA